MDDVVGIISQICTYQLVKGETVGVAVVISVSENPAVSSALGLVQGRNLGVILPIQRSLTCRLVLKQLHLILEHTQTERDIWWDKVKCYDS